jgi:hypothetical protein
MLMATSGRLYFLGRNVTSGNGLWSVQNKIISTLHAPLSHVPVGNVSNPSFSERAGEICFRSFSGTNVTTYKWTENITQLSIMLSLPAPSEIFGPFFRPGFPAVAMFALQGANINIWTWDGVARTLGAFSATVPSTFQTLRGLAVQNNTAIVLFQGSRNVWTEGGNTSAGAWSGDSVYWGAWLPHLCRQVF